MKGTREVKLRLVSKFDVEMLIVHKVVQQSVLDSCRFGHQ